MGRHRPTTTAGWIFVSLALAGCRVTGAERRVGEVDPPAASAPVARRRPTLQPTGPADPLAAVKAALAERAAARGSAAPTGFPPIVPEGLSATMGSTRPWNVASRGPASGRPTTLVLNVQDLLWAPTHFVAPEIDLFASGMTRDAPERFETAPLFREDLLLDLIRAAVAPGTWDEPGNSIEIVDGKLIVTHE